MYPRKYIVNLGCIMGSWSTDSCILSSEHHRTAAAHPLTHTEPSLQSHKYYVSDRWQWKRYVAPQKMDFKDNRHKIFAPLAMSTNLQKIKLKKKKTKKTCLGGSKTDGNENAMLQSFLSKLFPKETCWSYARTAATCMGKTGKNVCFFRVIYSRCCCTRRNLRFHVENCQHVDKKQLTRR